MGFSMNESIILSTTKKNITGQIFMIRENFNQILRFRFYIRILEYRKINSRILLPLIYIMVVFFFCADVVPGVLKLQCGNFNYRSTMLYVYVLENNGVLLSGFRMTIFETRQQFVQINYSPEERK